MHPAFASGPCDVIPVSLKYVRYRDLNDKSHKGEFTKSDVYYHRKSMVNGTWWLEIPPREGDEMFEGEKTPEIYPIQKAGS